MKLNDLLTQITPLPYSVCELPHGFRPVIVAHDGEVAIVSGTSGSKQETEANAAYLNHCANLFPELVKALEDLVNDGECYCADEMKTSCGHCLAKELLTRANEIKI